MRLNILCGLTLFVLLTTGCAKARVWQRTDSNISTSRQEIETALHRCEQSPEVQIAHNRANAWDATSNATLWIPFVGLATNLTADSVTTQYQNRLIECMKRAGYTYHKETSNKLRWNKMSDFDISMEEWNKEQPRNQLTPTPIIPSLGTTTVLAVIWTSANIRSGAGDEFSVLITANKGDVLTVIGERGEWFNVRLKDGKEGWINSRAVKRQEYVPEKPMASTPIIPSSGTTTPLAWDFSLAMSGPGNNYPVIATFRKGDRLTILEQSGEWVKVRSESDQVGWVRSEVFE